MRVRISGNKDRFIVLGGETSQARSRCWNYQFIDLKKETRSRIYERIYIWSDSKQCIL